MRSGVEVALGRHRALTIAALVLLTAMAWFWLLGGAGMRMGSFASVLPPEAEETAMPGMAMGPEAWSSARFALTGLMWFTMMVAMMLPSAAPTILLYSRAARRDDPEATPSSASFLAGYLSAWAGYSLLATGLQVVLEHSRALGAMKMASQSRWLSAAILIAAGLYQLTPAKDVCLRHCRNPAQFLSLHYRSGRIGALGMGMVHGTYCIGCCFLLMLLLFVGGVMNLAWIALLTLMVAAEKLLPQGRAVASVAGWVCLAWGTAIVIRLWL